MSNRKKPEPPEDPRQKIRIYRDGLHLLSEFYIDPDRKVIDIDFYVTLPTPGITTHLNYPAERVKKP